ncbi:hypothetical protein [Halobellus rubicundus]|uniref:Uncharacterized protein n=1 Tax=Halobellus rubicundus TaxID=2996466 RepID=A0ABD5MFR4_9EURY
MNLKLTLVAVVLLGLLVAPPAAAQSTETTPTTTSADNSTALLQVDDYTTVVEKSYDRSTGVLTLTIESERFTSISLLAVKQTDASSGSASFESTNIRPGQRVTVQIDAPPNTRVWISSDRSRQNGVLHFIKTSEGSALISGPWTAADVRNAGLASAAGVALMVLYRLVLERSAVAKEGERVA